MVNLLNSPLELSYSRTVGSNFEILVGQNVRVFPYNVIENPERTFWPTQNIKF